MSSNTTRLYDNVRIIGGMQDAGLAVNAFLAADREFAAGREGAAKAKAQHLRLIQNRYWNGFFTILSSHIARKRGVSDLNDDERLFIDMGLVDSRMLSPDTEQQIQGRKALLAEHKAKSLTGCHYLSEWFQQRQQQLQVERDLTGVEQAETGTYASQLTEARRRVLWRLSSYLSGLPGIPLEVSEAMRSGELDSAVISLGINALRDPKRKNFLRRRNLWNIREQILAKARARAGAQGAGRLFDMLGEVYTREWRYRHDQFVTGAGEPKTETQQETTPSDTVSSHIADSIIEEARQMRMRMNLLAAVDGRDEPDILLAGLPPRLSKEAVAHFMATAQTFDRELSELPPMVILPCGGRGLFAWEIGCLLLALRPVVGVEDSVATALAWYRIFDDRLNHNHRLRDLYMAKFPGAIFEVDFPADYRAWLCRLTKGEAKAMDGDRRVFFRDNIGPVLKGPLLPPNLRNVGPQTIVAICRRLEKQVAGEDSDVTPHRRLAVLFWHLGEMESARSQFLAAMRIAPEDGETLFAAGMFLRGQDDPDAANECFRTGADRAANSMWGLYCQDALANLI